MKIVKGSSAAGASADAANQMLRKFSSGNMLDALTAIERAEAPSMVTES